jgi:hypothetical protein
LDEVLKAVWIFDPILTLEAFIPEDLGSMEPSFTVGSLKRVILGPIDLGSLCKHIFIQGLLG